MTENNDILYRRSGKDMTGEINTTLLFISREGQEYLSKFVTRMICAWVALTRSRLVHMTISRKFSKKKRKSVRDNPLRFPEYMYDQTILVSQINKYSKPAMPSLCTLTNLDNLLMSDDVWERGCVNSAVLVELEKKYEITESRET